jgi:hypothetical protein
VAGHLFAPAYIAGWSACQLWGFTEQIFRYVAVFTAVAILERKLAIGHTVYVPRKIPEEPFLGTRLPGAGKSVCMFPIPPVTSSIYWPIPSGALGSATWPAFKRRTSPPNTMTEIHSSLIRNMSEPAPRRSAWEIHSKEFLKIIQPQYDAAQIPSESRKRIRPTNSPNPAFGGQIQSPQGLS